MKKVFTVALVSAGIIGLGAGAVAVAQGMRDMPLVAIDWPDGDRGWRGGDDDDGRGPPHRRGEHGERGGKHRHHAERRGRGRGEERMRERLRAFDANGDGVVTQEEVDTFRQAQITRFDTDGNGTLSLAEYEALWLDAMRERMVDTFQAHDDDGDGAVTFAEFNERFARMIARIDRDGDGQVEIDPRRNAPATPAAPPTQVPGGDEEPGDTL